MTKGYIFFKTWNGSKILYLVGILNTMDSYYIYPFSFGLASPIYLIEG